MTFPPIFLIEVHDLAGIMGVALTRYSSVLEEGSFFAGLLVGPSSLI